MSAEYFIGNWKMNKVKTDIDTFFTQFEDGLTLNTSKKIVICPPACYLDYIKSKISSMSSEVKSMIEIGGQYFGNPKGSGNLATGVLKASQLKDCNATYALVGQSECRQSQPDYQGVTDAVCNSQVIEALDANLKVVLCVGEPLSVYEEEETTPGTIQTYIKNQIETALTTVDSSNLKTGNIIIAYEPIWAIGTGKICTAEIAEDRTAMIKSIISTLYDQLVANSTKILFGGSLKASNAAEYLSQPHINGALVGNLSLRASDFAALINVNI